MSMAALAMSVVAIFGSAAPVAASESDLPSPEGGYGSYHLEYHITGIPQYEARFIVPTLNTDFNRWFQYPGCPTHVKIGSRCNLDTPFGIAPVVVVGLTDYGFALRSLPGHFEGEGRTIRFTFYTADKVGLPNDKTMHVDAWGPVSNLSVGGPFNGTGADIAAWRPFANKINNDLPKKPLHLGSQMI